MTITVGTKIKVTDTQYPSKVPNGSVMTVTYAYKLGDIRATLMGGDGGEWYMDAETYEVLESDTQDTPTLWKDMTPEEKGALLLANHEGKAIEWYRSFCLKWEPDDNFDPTEHQHIAYRIALHKPVVDVRSLYIYQKDSDYSLTEIGTIYLIDGVPDAGSIKMFEV